MPGQRLLHGSCDGTFYDLHHDGAADACLTYPALERIVQAGAKPIGWVQLLCELQRDWQRAETANEFAEILFAVEGH